MNKTLPILINEKRAIYDVLDQEGGELDAALELWLDRIDQDLSVKTDSYRIVLEELEADALRLRKKAQDFAGAAKTLENVVDRLKTRIKQAMDVLGTDCLEGELYRFKLSPGAAKLIVDESLLPTEYKLIKQETVVDKERIKEDLRRGIEIPGVQEEPTLRLLPQIRKGN